MKPNSPFPCQKSDIIKLANECAKLFEAQPIVIEKLKPPVKIIGDLHGSYIDLMRFFDIWKSPTDDVHAYDYIFLGNYVDKGFYSLEVVCLLFALILKYP